MLAAECYPTDEFQTSTRAVSGKIGIPSYGHTSEDVCEFQDVGDGGEQQEQEVVT